MTEREDRSGQQQAAQREKIFWLPKRRLRKVDKDRVKQILGERDGLKCAICGKPESVGNLELDHVNENPADNRLDNIRLAHHSCNSSLFNLKRASIPPSGHEREKIQVVGSVFGRTGEVQGLVDYGGGSPEMQVTGLCELAWRNWLVACVLRDGYVSRTKAVYDGAEQVGCSPSTTWRYLRKACFPWSSGPFAAWKNGSEWEVKRNGDHLFWKQFQEGGKPVE